MAETTERSLTEQLAAFLAATPAEAIPTNVLRVAPLYVLDWLGSALAGSCSAVGTLLHRYAEQQPAAGATCLGLDQGRSPGVAALHNGAVSHILEMDDLDRASVLHPGCVVIPAALALAETRGTSGRELLAAVVLGYEVAIRIGEAVGKRHYWYWHNTATCGVYGAAAAAGALLGLSRERFVWALGNAGTQSAGLWQFLSDGAMSKHLHAGHAAAGGLLAAELAALGFTGPRRILEGERGFFAATAPDARPELVVAGLEPGMARYKLPGVSFKPYPSCRHTHPAVDAALVVRARLGGTLDEIERVEIDTYQAALDLCDNPAPVNPYQAKFSLHYTVARALLQGNLVLADFEPERLHDAPVRALIARTVARLDPAAEARYPAEWPSQVTVTLRDGRRASARVANPKGDPENPLSPAEAETKFRGMLAGTPFERSASALIDLVAALPELPSVRGALPAALAGATVAA